MYNIQMYGEGTSIFAMNTNIVRNLSLFSMYGIICKHHILTKDMVILLLVIMIFLTN